VEKHLYVPTYGPSCALCGRHVNEAVHEVIETQKLKDGDFALPANMAPADLEALKDALQKAVMEALLAPGKLPLYSELMENPLACPTQIKAMKDACVVYTGWDDLAKLTFTTTLPTADDRRLGRSATVVVAGPAEVMDRICFGPLEAGRLAELVDVDIVVEKEAKE